MVAAAAGETADGGAGEGIVDSDDFFAFAAGGMSVDDAVRALEEGVVGGAIVGDAEIVLDIEGVAAELGELIEGGDE